jgi:hypothetical protein
MNIFHANDMILLKFVFCFLDRLEKQSIYIRIFISCDYLSYFHKTSLHFLFRHINTYTSCVSRCSFSSFFLPTIVVDDDVNIAILCCLFVTTTTRTIHSSSSRTLHLVDNSRRSNNKNKYATARAYCFYTHT